MKLALKKWLFWFFEALVCVFGKNQMCRLCGCQKLVLKNESWKKNNKLWVSRNVVPEY